MIETLRAYHFDLQVAADTLGISRASLYNLMERSSRIRRASDLEAQEVEACIRRFPDDYEAMVSICKFRSAACEGV